jgi:hypothetical protein
MNTAEKIIDRLFERLAATYGSHWTRQWADVPMASVKSAWSLELGAYLGRLEPVRWALENLPERCPNAIEFKHLCRAAPAPISSQLSTPAPNPDLAHSEVANARALLARPIQKDGMSWVARFDEMVKSSNKRISPTVRRFVEEARAIRDKRACIHLPPSTQSQSQ